MVLFGTVIGMNPNAFLLAHPWDDLFVLDTGLVPNRLNACCVEPNQLQRLANCWVERLVNQN